VLDILLVLFFGCVGYALRLLRFEPAPLLVGLVLGPLLEEHLRRSLIVSHGSLWIFLQKPVSAAILIIAAAVLVWMFWKSPASPPVQTVH